MDQGAPKAIVEDATYSVTFKISYETKFGQELAVVGSIGELGEWKDYDHWLQWTDGHIWVSKAPLITKSSTFRYKYALLDTDRNLIWESGVDRVAELSVLPA